MMSHDDMIAVIQAHKDGKKIQFRRQEEGDSEEWADVAGAPSWAFNISDYRIKPEPPKPREWWMRSHRITGEPCTSCGLFTDPVKASEHGSDHQITACIVHVREVLGDSSVSSGNERG